MYESILTAVTIIGVIGIGIGVALAISSKLFAVKVDEKVEKIKNILPGANCGACGYSGCEGYAEGVAAGLAEANQCPVGGTEVAEEIAAIMGTEISDSGRMVARVKCVGVNRNKKHTYQGIQTCASASSLFGGDNQCTYGCLGLGDCVKECPFDAICLEDGVAIINEEKCKGCEKCVAVCPKSIIEMVPETARVTVMCSSKEKGKNVIQACKDGCITCRKCIKACPFDAIDLKDGLIAINYDKCKNCGICVKECPTGVIKKYDKLKK